MEKPGSRITLMLALAYLFLVIGVTMLSLYVNLVSGLHPALTVALMFGGSALIAWLFHLRFGGRGWLITARVGGIATVFLLTLYLAVAGFLHPALLFALYAFLAAGMVLYAINRRRSADARALNAQVEWRKLGAQERDERRAA